MLKSIYVKNALNYILISFISIIVAFLIAHFVFQKQENQKQREQFTSTGKQIIYLYKTLNRQEFLKTIKIFPETVTIYNRSGLVLQSGHFKNQHAVDRQKVNRVLSGNEVNGVQMPRQFDGGLPFKIDQQPYALFIKPDIKGKIINISVPLFEALSVALLTGILLILLTTRFLVRPIIEMTSATRALARGNFETKIAVRNKDEIGELAKSFNAMVEELNKTEKMRKEFVANVSHELQSPLTAIRGMALAVKDDVVGSQEKNHYIELIEQESTRLSHLTKQLLNLSSLDARQYFLHTKFYRLDRQIRNEIVAMQTLWSEKQLDVDVNLPKLEIEADQNLMGQVWANLLTNAIKYNWPGGKIRVDAQSFGQEIEVVIANTGPGIPEKDIPFIFERFYKVDKAHTRTEKSYGLGLAIVKRIIDLHHAAIIAESVPDEETLFRIKLKKQLHYTES